MNIDGDVLLVDDLELALEASMEPSMNIDGDRRPALPPRTPRSSFNGAVDEHRRRHPTTGNYIQTPEALQWSRR